MAMATPIAHKGNLAGSKVMAMTMVDLLLRPELVAAAKTYFNDVQLKSQRPQSLLAETDQPQVQINRDTMARFRPEMRKFYYDASKYDTYLDQLGVKFPQLTKPQ
jgi:aminobenzoyl-glutamate utilization protein B